MLQILLREFLEMRKKMHEPYRVWRASNAQQLHDDFARSQKNEFEADGNTMLNACLRGQPNVVQRFLDGQ